MEKLTANENDMTSDLTELKIKRTETLLGVWESFVKKKIVAPNRFRLSTPLLNEIVEHYAIDIEILKLRYKIKNKIQLHKIAGLMTSLILRYRPVIPLIEEYQTEDEIYVNELFAVIHGLSVCSEYSSQEDTERLINEFWFSAWLHDFKFLLHHRHHTPEALSFVYETLSFFRFPRNFTIETKD